MKYRCVISDGAGNSITSDEATISLGDLKITQQPEDKTIGIGKKVELSLEAEGEKLTYQWQYQWADSAEWNKWGTGNGYQVTPTNMGWQGLKYRCVVTNQNGRQLTSKVATFTFGPLTVEKQPQDMTASVGEELTLTIDAGGPVQEYLWQYHWAGESEWKQWGKGNGYKTAKVAAKWH